MFVIRKPQLYSSINFLQWSLKMYTLKKANNLQLSKHLKRNFATTNSLCYALATEEDTFGLIAQEQGLKVFKELPESMLFEPEQNEEDDRYIPLSEKKSVQWYHNRCKKLAKQGKLDDCVHTLETKMLKEDKVQPFEHNFSVVIGALARNGQTEKAYSLFVKLKRYGITPTAPTYCGLFNAFANSVVPIDLDRVKILYNKIEKKENTLNRIAFCALLKVYAKHGTIQEALGIFRDSIAAGFEPDVATFTHLFLSCGNNKESGYRYALQIWRNMTSLGINPDAPCLMNFLAVVLKCDIGDISIANKVLLQPSSNKLKYFLKRNIRQFRWLKGQESLPNPIKYDQDESTDEPMELLGLVSDSGAQEQMSSVMLEHKQMCNDTAFNKCKISDHSSHFSNFADSDFVDDSITKISNASEDILIDETEEKLLEIKENSDIQNHAKISNSSKVSIESTLPTTSHDYSLSTINILENCKLQSVVSLRKCPKPSDRLQLIGGLQGVLDIMKQYNIPPSARVYTALAKTIGPSCTEEDMLMNVAEQSTAILDIDFYNCIMHRRAKRNHHKEAKEIFERIEMSQLTPNYRTWCICAMSCFSFEEGKKLMDTVKENNITPSGVLLTTLIFRTLNGRHKRKVTGYSNVYYPNYNYLSYLLQELKINNVLASKKLVIQLEKATAWPKGYNRWKLSDPVLEREISKFRRMYKQWLVKTDCEEN